jgi:UDP-N-acetylmuramyl pentapeptide phosphotransferase/UDP-N-acetylglucosamine-1-phosphate transferase
LSNLVVFIAAAAVLLVVLAGFFNMIRGGEGAPERSQTLMRWRVGLQFLALAIALAACASALITRWSIHYARQRGMLDLPGARRSHRVPTPRGGGIGIVVTITVLGLVPLALVEPAASAACALALLAVAAVGWIDDHRGLHAGVRLLVHGLGAACVIAGLAPDVAPSLLPVLLVLVAWSVNLHNFMDGINGLLGLQAVAFFGVLGVFAALAADGPLLWLCAAAAGASAGFLPFNMPRAQVFLGDVGSGAIGLVVGIAAVLACRRDVLDPGGIAILLCAPLVDASATVLSRALRGRRWWAAHREHLYQWLVRSGFSHTRVACGYFAVSAMLAPGILYLRETVNRGAWAAAHRDTAQLLYFAGWPTVVLSLALIGWLVGRQWCLRRVRHRPS